MNVALIGKMLKNRIATPQKDVYAGPIGGTGPLSRLRLGGILDTTKAAASFLNALTGGSMMVLPPGTAQIAMHGKIFDGPFTIHRFYFDGAGTGFAEYFLQVIAQADTIVAGEVKLFRKLEEISPQTEDEWNVWLKGSDVDAPLLMGTSIMFKGNTEFKRVWQPGVPKAEPKSWIETVQVGDESSKKNNITMLFSRQLVNDVTEWLQLTVIRHGTERWIEADIGITIDPNELSAI